MTDAGDAREKYLGHPFTQRLQRAERNEQSARDLLLEEIAAKYMRIKSPRSRLAAAARAWLHHRWGTL